MTDDQENDISLESKTDQEEQDEFESLFSPLNVDELPITDPIELKDAASISHRSLVQASAAVSADSAMLLALRSCRALIAALSTYKASLHHLLELLQYHQTTLLTQAKPGVAGGAVCSAALAQLEAATVPARAAVANDRKMVQELQLLCRVSWQCLELTAFACHITAADGTASTATSMLTALRQQVEMEQRQVRSLAADILATESNVIQQEQQQQQQHQEHQSPNRNEQESNDRNKRDDNDDTEFDSSSSPPTDGSSDESEMSPVEDRLNDGVGTGWESSGVVPFGGGTPSSTPSSIVVGSEGASIYDKLRSLQEQSPTTTTDLEDKELLRF